MIKQSDGLEGVEQQEYCTIAQKRLPKPKFCILKAEKSYF